MAELERSLVYTNLNYTWTFYGLQVFHFAIAGGFGSLGLFIAVLLNVGTGYAIAAFLGVCAGLIVLQWRKPTTYLPDLFLAMLAPTDLTPALDDEVTWDFPIPREALRR